MKTYIQRRGDGYLETVDEFPTRREALAMLREYRMADPTAHHYLSSRACKAWTADTTPTTATETSPQ